ncbi:Replication factor RFC1 C terminal domain containing protein [Amanita muscaria]
MPPSKSTSAKGSGKTFFFAAPAGKNAASSSSNLKRKHVVISDDEDDEIQEVPKPSSSAPMPPAKKSSWIAIKAAKSAPPPAHGSKAVPDGEPNCLAGLAFVFTGELSSFARDEAIDIAKRYGGRVTLQPSSKTSFVVLGDNAGPAKLAAIKKHGLNMLNEDQFLNLIATRKAGHVDEKTKKKLAKEQEAIRQAAKEMEKKEKEDAKKEDKQDGPSGASIKGGNLSSQLWTTRYAPQSLKDVCGNKSQVEKLQQWLHDWPSSLKSGFKKPGKNGANMFRAVLITGSPGVGKTTSAHLCAKLEGFTPIELNASDVRSKRLVESGLNINNTSLDGYLHGDKATNALGVSITDKSCIIMDEVDGMSAGDRGGVGALNALIKKSMIPIICIANDRQAQKLKPLIHTTFSIPFQKPPVNMIRSRILSIAYKEKMKIPANVIDQLITSAQSDIRQVLNMLSTWKLSSDTMDFDESKSLAKMNEKYTVMSPFDITTKILGPYLFSPSARESLGDKMDLYFQDHSFVPLFIQENYLRSQPARMRNLEGPEKILRHLELMDKAASSLSDGDLVDSLIHGPEQHWSLMPLHAILSTIRPSSSMYGNGVHYGGPNSMAFPQWLGQNSKQNKLMRQLSDIQAKMRLKVSGDKSEIRHSYIPAFHPHLVQPLAENGTTAAEKVIRRMDEYYLSKEDWDTIVELGVGDHKDEIILKKIPPATKTAFTRKYNSSEHPIAFHKAHDLGKAPKKIAGGPTPDLEEAYEVDEIAEELSEEDEKKEKNKDDLSADKLIQAPKKKKVTNTASDKAKNKVKR